MGISIHTLLAESDHRQSTFFRTVYNFYPHSPCGERRQHQYQTSFPICISIHTLLAESDFQYPLYMQLPHVFLSTLSLRRATMPMTERIVTGFISIHTLLAESDVCSQLLFDTLELISIHTLLAESDQKRYHGSPAAGKRAGCYHFYPHSPCGERLGILGWRLWYRKQFLSTLSLRRATAKVHKTVEHFCAYETNFMGIASSC